MGGMISRIEGRLVGLDNQRIQLLCGHLVYELFIPASDRDQLAEKVGEDVQFHTLQYLEAQGQGSQFIPRLIGFSSTRDKAFFELITTVKGLGNRKALRAIALPFPIIAGAIADRDHALLQSLPEIGRKTAETIVVDLHEKMEGFTDHVGSG